MALQTKETPLLLVVPEFDKTIVAAGYEEGQLRVEVDSSAGSIVALYIGEEVHRTWQRKSSYCSPRCGPSPSAGRWSPRAWTGGRLSL